MSLSKLREIISLLGKFKPNFVFIQADEYLKGNQKIVLDKNQPDNNVIDILNVTGTVYSLPQNIIYLKSEYHRM